ncbi:MAG: hypothetical protein LBK82_09330 [Planctomycetaceae bacterium]|nr:hypothetical protein [Planctomycetaceae bacterium]
MLLSVLESIQSQLARPFSEGSPTSFHEFSYVARLKRTFQRLDTYIQ